jgi:hypothetical protein
MRNALKSLITVVFGCLFCVGCTGTNFSVTPDSASINLNVVKKCGVVAVRETPADHVYPPAGNLVPGFATALERSGLAENVYSPARPDDKVDLILDTKFDVVFDPNMGGNLTKSFFTGFTFFLLEPVFWFNYNYNLRGEVNILEGKTKMKTLLASSAGEFSVKMMSLSEVQKLEGETLSKAKESLYRQLLAELCNYCNK